jgi:hypothetical protein
MMVDDSRRARGRRTRYFGSHRKRESAATRAGASIAVRTCAESPRTGLQTENLTRWKGT